jgi:hypothetical protein
MQDPFFDQMRKSRGVGESALIEVRQVLLDVGQTVENSQLFVNILDFVFRLDHFFAVKFKSVVFREYTGQH